MKINVSKSKKVNKYEVTKNSNETLTYTFEQ